jgi:hypothetical protein
VEECVALFGDRSAATALDRFTHRAHQIVIEESRFVPPAAPRLARGGSPPQGKTFSGSAQVLLTANAALATAGLRRIRPVPWNTDAPSGNGRSDP